MKLARRRNLFLLLVGAAFFFAGGCSEDGGRTTPDGAVIPPDLGPVVDPGSCTGIHECVSLCTDVDFKTCEDDCIANGTATGQELYKAVKKCESSALEGACATDCTGGNDEICADCMDGACKSNWDDCLADT